MSRLILSPTDSELPTAKRPLATDRFWPTGDLGSLLQLCQLSSDFLLPDATECGNGRKILRAWLGTSLLPGIDRLAGRPDQEAEVCGRQAESLAVARHPGSTESETTLIWRCVGHLDCGLGLSTTRLPQSGL